MLKTSLFSSGNAVHGIRTACSSAFSFSGNQRITKDWISPSGYFSCRFIKSRPVRITLAVPLGSGPAIR